MTRILPHIHRATILERTSTTGNILEIDMDRLVVDTVITVGLSIFVKLDDNNDEEGVMDISK